MEYQKFKVIHSYVVSMRSAWVTWDSVSIQKQTDYIHDVLQGSVKFTGKQVQSIQVLEKQNKT